MLINLLPDFFAILDSTDRIAAYRSFFERHRRLLQAYWHNYVIDPDSPHFADVVRSTVLADRGDLLAQIHQAGRVAQQSLHNGAFQVTAYVPPKVAGRIRKALTQ